MSSFAGPANCQLADTGERQLEEGRSALEEGTLESAGKSFESCTQQASAAQTSTAARCFYDLGRADFYLSRAKDFKKDKKGAERWLDLAIRETKRAVELDDHNANAHALLADLYGTKIGYGGALTAMRLGSKADAETKRAFQLDPKNAFAYAVTGRRQLYAPKMFGGDLDQAVESFRKATLLDPRNDEAFVWLAIAYRKKGDSVGCRAALGEALRLNSRSAFAKRIQSGAPD